VDVRLGDGRTGLGALLVTTASGIPWVGKASEEIVYPTKVITSGEGVSSVPDGWSEARSLTIEEMRLLILKVNVRIGDGKTGPGTLSVIKVGEIPWVGRRPEEIITSGEGVASVLVGGSEAISLTTEERRLGSKLGVVVTLGKASPVPEGSFGSVPNDEAVIFGAVSERSMVAVNLDA
jgi:hypothetical protein